MLGTVNQNYVINPSKANIYWFNLEWLGVGFVDCGVIIDGQMITCHRFTHSNLIETPHISNPSLPPTYEIISSGGNGSMTTICQTAINEGDYLPRGNIFSVNMGTSTQVINNNREPLIVLRLKPNTISIASLRSISIISTSGANTLIEIYKFVDKDVSSILNNTTFISAGDSSSVEYNLDASNINITDGLLFHTKYFSNNNDSIVLNGIENDKLTMSNGISDVIAICATSLGGNENYIASASWIELI